MSGGGSGRQNKKRDHRRYRHGCQRETCHQVTPLRGKRAAETRAEQSPDQGDGAPLPEKMQESPSELLHPRAVHRSFLFFFASNSSSRRRISSRSFGEARCAVSAPITRLWAEPSNTRCISSPAKRACASSFESAGA